METAGSRPAFLFDPRVTLDYALGALLGAVLLVAAIGNAWEPGPFLRFIAWLVTPAAALPRQMLVAFGGLIVSVEAFMGIAVACGWRARWLVGSVLGLSLVFLLVQLALLLDPRAPPCGCTGFFGRSIGQEDGGWVGLVRTGGMSWVGAWLLVRAWRHPRSDRPVRPHSAFRGSASAGFTLVETLVVLLVLAVILAVMLPALLRSREQSRMSRSLSTHRQLHAAAAQYAEDHRGYLPYFATPGDPDGPKAIDGFDVPGGYFRAQTWHWASLLVPEYFAPRQAIERADMAERLASMGWPERIVRSTFQLTHAAFASPRYWEGDDPPDDLRLLHGVRLSDAAFSASKGMMVDIGVGLFVRSEGGREQVGTDASIGMMDGSATVRRWNWDPVLIRPFGALPWMVYMTRGGMAGRDF